MGRTTSTATSIKPLAKSRPTGRSSAPSRSRGIPELESRGYFDLLDGVYRTGQPYAVRSRPLHLDIEDGDRFIDLLYNPIVNDAGEITGIFISGYDTTDAKRAEDLWRTLSDFSDRLRLLSNADDLPYQAAGALGTALRASRVGYGTIEDETATLFVDRDFTQQGVESLAGATPLLNYGSFIESLRRGEFVAIEDVRLDPRTSMAAAALEGKAARSFVNVPVLEHGSSWRCCLSITRPSVAGDQTNWSSSSR